MKPIIHEKASSASAGGIAKAVGHWTDFKFHSPSIRLHTFGELEFIGALSKSHVISLCNYYLPKAPFSEGPVEITHNSELLCLAFSAIEVYAISCSKSKSLPQQLANRFILILKIIEYGWLRSCYSMTDWSENDFIDLASEVGLLGWVKALKIYDRILELPALDSATLPTSMHLFAAIGSNAQPGNLAGQLRLEKSRVWANKRSKDGFTWGVVATATHKMTTTTLTPILEACNTLCELTACQVPFRRPNAYAKDLLGKGGKSTKSLSADSLADLMVETVSYAERVGQNLEDIFKELLIWRKSFPRTENLTVDQWEAALSNCKVTSQLERVVGKKINLTRSKDNADRLNLYSIVTAYHVSAFMPLAFMNCRRKDEICHPEVGIQQSSMTLAHDNLGLYTVSFYIEKTFKSRLPFYVNQLSQDLIGGLSKLSKVAQDLASHHTVSAEQVPYFANSVFLIFDVRRMHGSGNRIRHFQYLNANTSAWRYVRSLFGRDVENLHPRMMRRAYALLFHYRYENARLSALSQKLGHFDLGQVGAYIYDKGDNDVIGQALYGPFTASQRAALDEELILNKAAIDEVGAEKLLTLIESVMQSDEFLVGGFVKLIRRYASIVKSEISYQSMDKARIAKRVAHGLTGRGHKSLPKSDGDCWRGESTSKHRGGCQSEGDLGAMYERATPITCNDCAYHAARKQHTVNLRNDAAQLTDDLKHMASNSLDAARIASELKQTKIVIGIREQRELDKFNGQMSQ